MQHRARYFFLLAIATCFCSLGSAQVETYSSMVPQNLQSNGQPSITGTITGTDGTPLHDIRIEVRSLLNGNLAATCYSEMNGSFTAFNLRPGTYEVSAVDGVTQTSEQVDVDGMATNVTLRMSSRGSSTPPGRGTVSVAQLKTPEKARRLFDKAKASMAKKKVDEARKQLDEAVAIAPGYPDALTLRASIEVTSSQVPAAIEDLDLAIKADPSYGPAYLMLGAVYNQMGRYDEALRSLDRSSMYDPTSWQCAYETSKAWLGKHDYQHALSQINRAQALGGERVGASIHLVRGYALMGAKQFEQAGHELEAYLTAEPNGQLTGSVRAALAKIKTLAVQRPDSLALPAMTGFFANTK